ncbi:uracil-DNA glycosylase family protein [Neptuniibacter halophilus]|uniref:uracil-DNA glycosylase family protein n=1 Tax=Neptuniibacter halophilus TaxID=651666 RepID=UPI00257267B6|nr:uracil-DNA glycosylase family protein [Neptuniibacter halophilus]
MDELGPFYTRLAKRKNSLTVFNPYREPFKLANLQRYLELVFAQSGPRVMLVGEAPGFKGCRLTGIPFSSGRLFSDIQHPFLKALASQIELDPSDLSHENTASIVWNYLSGKSIVPLFWNAFPFHPHPSRVQKKNRAPNRLEQEEGMSYLTELVDLYQPEYIAGLGRKGADSVQKMFPQRSVAYIRHPSYGGKQDFIQGMELLLHQTRL